MTLSNKAIQILGGLIFLVGGIGVFARFSQDDGAIAIAGAIVFASGVIAQAIMRSK